jgi:putative two-component system response regulator
MDNTHDAKILLVDDTPSNIKVLVETLRGDYRLAVATNGREAISDAMSASPPDLILLDVMMPEMDGYEVIGVLKNNDATRHIPIIFVTALSDEKDEHKGFELGAVDYIVKPINPPIVKARVRTHIALKKHQDRLEDLVSERTFQLHETTFEIVNRLARAAEYRDNETGLHITRMSHYCSIIGDALGMSGEECELLHHAASMHDVGKIGISDQILLKPGKFEKHEFETMKTHTTIGAELLSGHDSRLLKVAAVIAHTHHEKFDGAGYPRGLSEEDIPIFGRITSVCDVFDALTSERPYKKAWDVDRALSELINGKDSQFDPDMVDLFVENMPAILSVKDRFADNPMTRDLQMPKRMTA